MLDQQPGCIRPVLGHWCHARPAMDRDDPQPSGVHRINGTQYAPPPSVIIEGSRIA
jgi:hypothetical protein